MAYIFTNDDGHAQVGGSPSREEHTFGEAREARHDGELVEFEELYGDD